MRLLQKILLTHERFWRKVRRRLRGRYLSYVLGAMGKNCQICDGVIITDPEYTFIGNRVKMNEGVILLTFDLNSTITIGDDVTLSYGVNVITGGLDLSDGIRHDKHVMASVTIEDRAWIGAKAILLSCITIGHGSVVAAGSLVNQDVAPNTIVAGIPAKVIKTLSKEEKS